MREKVRSDDGRKIYQMRKQSVEPVLGIIKCREEKLRAMEVLWEEISK